MMFDDISLRDRVLDALDWEPELDAAHIGVTVKNGIVTLTGFVDNYPAKKAAELTVSKIRGVKALAEEIEVRLPNAQKHADDQIAERALRILAWDIGVPHERISVKVEKGVITLTGEVDRHFQRTATEAAVRRLGGVRGVVNLIAINPDRTRTIDLEDVKANIERTLRRAAELEASGIRIDVNDGRVTIAGQVHTWFERNLVENAAWSIPGVLDVDDKLRVQP